MCGSVDVGGVKFWGGGGIDSMYLRDDMRPKTEIFRGLAKAGEGFRAGVR